MVSRVLIRSLEWLLIVMLGLMVILVFGNVVLRYGFNSGITFSEEVSRFLFVWVVFLGAFLTLRDSGHLGVYTLVKKLPMTGKKIFKFINDLTVLACCVLLTHGIWRVVKLNLANIAPVSGISLGIVYVVCLISSAAMCFFLLYSLYRLLTGKITEKEICPDFDAEDGL
jgi:TRAP-type transport system small permease protein